MRKKQQYVNMLPWIQLIQVNNLICHYHLILYPYYIVSIKLSFSYYVEWGLIQVYVIGSYFQAKMLYISKGGFNTTFILRD